MSISVSDMNEDCPLSDQCLLVMALVFLTDYSSIPFFRSFCSRVAQIELLERQRHRAHSHSEMTAEKWAAYVDSDGRIVNGTKALERIFYGVCPPSFLCRCSCPHIQTLLLY